MIILLDGEVAHVHAGVDVKVLGVATLRCICRRQARTRLTLNPLRRNIPSCTQLPPCRQKPWRAWRLQPALKQWQCRSLTRMLQRRQAWSKGRWSLWWSQCLRLLRLSWRRMGASSWVACWTWSWRASQRQRLERAQTRSQVTHASSRPSQLPRQCGCCRWRSWRIPCKVVQKVFNQNLHDRGHLLSRPFPRMFKNQMIVLIALCVSSCFFGFESLSEADLELLCMHSLHHRAHPSALCTICMPGVERFASQILRWLGWRCD